MSESDDRYFSFTNRLCVKKKNFVDIYINWSLLQRREAGIQQCINIISCFVAPHSLNKEKLVEGDYEAYLFDSFACWSSPVWAVILQIILLSSEVFFFLFPLKMNSNGVVITDKHTNASLTAEGRVDRRAKWVILLNEVILALILNSYYGAWFPNF